MVFENEIDRALNPRLTWVTRGEKRLTLTEMKSRLEEKYPGRAVVGFVISPRNDIAWVASLQSKAPGGGPPFNVALNP